VLIIWLTNIQRGHFLLTGHKIGDISAKMSLRRGYVNKKEVKKRVYVDGILLNKSLFILTSFF